MSAVGEMRTSDGGIVEICTAIGDPGGYENWEPYVNVFVRSRVLEDPAGRFFSDSMSIGEHLRDAGWIPPGDDLQEHLCLAGVEHIQQPVLAITFRNRQCLLRRGHTGYHVNGNFSWQPVGCDYCDEGLPLDSDGWHLRVDPDGYEPTQRIPCQKRQHEWRQP